MEYKLVLIGNIKKKKKKLMAKSTPRIRSPPRIIKMYMQYSFINPEDPNT